MVAPSGMVTFLFTDIEGSTRLWERLPEAMAAALRVHDGVLRSAIAAHDGYVFTTAGDAFAVAFSSPDDAVFAAIDAFTALSRASWPETGPLRIRAGIHTGPADERDGDYFGPTVNRCARLMSAGHGGQLLLSGVAAGLVRDQLPGGYTLFDHGEHRLKDLEQPERVFEIRSSESVATFPPLRTLGSFATNLPEQPTSLVGRAGDVDKVVELVSGNRLVTLTGPGGAGKTRLALQVGADAVEQFPHGVWLVELGPLAEPALVPHAIAVAVGAGDQSESDMTSHLIHTVADRTMLIVLDNCEHLIDPVRAIVDALLQGTPRVKVLATSRERLGVAGEVRREVSPLAVPPRDAGGREPLKYASVELFADRVGAVRGGEALHDGELADAVEIVRHLDGIPLAIELAAARARVMPVGEIAARLNDRFRLLTGGSPQRLPRQQTLLEAIAWSYRLLSDEERLLFTRLAIFAGGFTLEAAHRVCGEVGDEYGTLDLLSQLVDKSLVRSDAPVAGQARFHLLETLREFGRSQLSADDWSELELRRTRYVRELAAEARRHFGSDAMVSWLDRLEADHDDLRAALRWAIDQQSPDVAADIGGKIWFFWYVRGYWDEGRSWMERALRDLAPEDTASRADALHVVGALASAQRHLDVAERALEDELALRRELGDRLGLSGALNNLANVLSFRQDYRGAIAMYEESLALSVELGEEQSTALNNLGWTALDETDLDLADDYFQRTIEQATAEGDPRNMAWGSLGRAIVAWLRTDLEAADRFLEPALEGFERLEERSLVVMSKCYAARIARDRRDIVRATEVLVGAFAVLDSIDDPAGMGRWCLVAASIAEQQDGREQAARLFGAATALGEDAEAFSPELTTVREALATKLGPARLEALMEEGRSNPAAAARLFIDSR